jgi:hypothetical protein
MKGFKDADKDGNNIQHEWKFLSVKFLRISLSRGLL